MSSKKVPAERVTQGQDPLSAVAEATLKWGAREFLTRSSLQDVVLFLGSTLCCTPPPHNKALSAVVWRSGAFGREGEANRTHGFGPAQVLWVVDRGCI